MSRLRCGAIPRSWQRAVALLLSGVLAFAVLGCNPLRILFPSHEYETVPPELPSDLGRPAVLLFTKTNGFRHEEAIPAGVALFESIASRRGWSLFHTDNGAVFNPDDLARFDVAVWHNTSGDTLDPDQKAAFEAWLEAGGGFVGIHGAGGDPSYDWAWYVETLLGAQFSGHILAPQFQQATVVVEDRAHPSMRHLDETWTHEEEWYSFEQSPRDRLGFRILASVDEASYSPMLFHLVDISMGDHPVIWSHCVGRGRAFYSALGHLPSAYASAEYGAVLEGAVAWAARLEGDGCD